jgi:hypothetical protein
MSQREGAPYADRVEEDGRVLIYEGHDIGKEGPDPKSVDQPETNPDGSLTQNVLFLEAAAKYKRGEREPEVVKVYEKIRPGIWAYNGLFKLVDAWKEKSSGRHVFKFKLELLGGHDFTSPRPVLKRSDTRMLRERILSLSQSQAQVGDREEYIASLASECRKLQIV